MRELNFIDRCVLFVILVVSSITMAGGVLVIMTEGNSEKAMVLLVCGGTTGIFTCGGILTSALLNRRSSNRSGNAEASPEEPFDPPPEYRFTWREEYLKKSPDSLREELEASPVRSKSVSKRDVRDVFEVGVHGGRRASAADQPGTSARAPPRRGRAATVDAATGDFVRSGGVRSASISVLSCSGDANGGYTADDDGLPSYEEVQRW